MQTNGYVICEYSKVKTAFPAFQDMMASLEANLEMMATSKWSPLTYGGTKPMAGQYGKTTVMPEMFVGFGGIGVGTNLVTWEQNFTATGSQVLIEGNGAGGMIPEDYMLGFAGLAFLEQSHQSQRDQTPNRRQETATHKH